MLRVSKRAFSERRAIIAESGFQCTTVDKENERDDADLVNDMFNFDTTLSRKNSRRRRTSRLSRGLPTSEDDERMRRFEAAYASMMMSMKPQDQPELMTSEKRWTRPEHLKPSISIDGRSYEAWKWGLTRPRRQTKAGTKRPSEMPFDRRASWMVHLPARESSSRRFTFAPALDSDGNPIETVNLYDHPELILSPGQMKFDELVMSLQHKDGTLVFPNQPHRGAGLEQYELHLEEYYRRQQGSPQFTRPNKLVFDNQFEPQDSTCIPSGGTGRASASHSVGSYSGSDLFGQATTMHAEEKKVDTANPASRERSGAHGGLRRESDIYSVGASSLGESDFFAQARKIHAAAPQDIQSAEEIIPYGQQESQRSTVTTSQQTPGRWKRASMEEPTLLAVPESDTQNETPEKANHSNAGKDHDPVAPSSSFRLGAAMGGLLNIMTGKKTSDSGESSLSAYAAFRERLESTDDSSSISSFRMLPESIRRAVHGLTATGKKPNDDGGLYNDGETSRPEFELVNPEKSSQYSPSRSISNRSGVESISPEHGKLIHQRYLESSGLMGNGELDNTIIDTDDTTSDASGAKMDAKTAASLLLSPTILTKRHRQAIKAVEKRHWKQVMYLISANPWLAEMMEVTTEQYLLHKVALYGSGEVELDEETGEIVATRAPAAPEQLNMQLIRMMPSSVHKFDKDGNLPLHMAAASGNVAMAKMLGEKFPGGASVRNEDGMLPLHLAIKACSSPLVDGEGKLIYGSDFVSYILKLFPRAVAVSDNEGDLPIHISGAVLQGDLGVDVVYMLLDEATKQAAGDTGIRFSELHQVKSADDDTGSVATGVTATTTDSSNTEHDLIHCNMVRNHMGQTALTMAIQATSGWEVIEAIARGPGGARAAMLPDANNCNSLHLLVSEEFGDPIAALSILKVAPKASSIHNAAGMLPIEIASMQSMPREVILALALVDLPFDLAENEGVKVREEFGGSWWFLACECDDYHVDLVEEIISICSYQQLRELCFMKGGLNGNGGPVISRATPKCCQLLRKALRFVGRFEFLGNAAIYTDDTLGLKVFEALDFGAEEEPFKEGRRVMLQCYEREDKYRQETSPVLEHHLDFEFVEEIAEFAVHESAAQATEGAPQQFCLAIQRPNLTLDRVVEGMQKKEEYRYNEDMRNRYMNKICMVLRLVAKAIRHLHDVGLVHGDICLETCGKFGDKWKLTNMLGSRKSGQMFANSRLSESSPPEAVDCRGDVPCFIDLEACRSVDIWAFGRLAFESLTGQALIEFDPDVEVESDSESMMQLFNWGEVSLRNMIISLRNAGVPNVGIDLISHCLLPNPADRPSTMDEILNHSFWKEMRRKTSSTPRSTSSSRASSLREI